MSLSKESSVSSTSNGSVWPLSTKSTALLIGASSLVGLGYFIYKQVNQPMSDDGGAFEQRIKKVEKSSVAVVSNEVKFARNAPSLGQIPILILFGTEYGCSQEIAKKIEGDICDLSGGKFYPRIVDMEDYELIEWNKEEVVVVVTSTYGDGVPPTRARKFFDNFEENPVNLQHLQFSVLALGDSSYPHFCRAGKTIDQLLENYGAKRFHKRSDVDLEDWGVIDRWCDAIIKKLPNLEFESMKENSTYELKEQLKSDYLWNKTVNYKQKDAFNRKKPYFAKLLVKEILTQVIDKEDKETIHYEFDLGTSGIQYVVGDSLGVMPINCHQLVDETIKALKTDPNQWIVQPTWKYQVPGLKTRGIQASLKDVMAYFYDLRQVKPKLIQLLLTEAEKQKRNSDIVKLKELLKDGVGKENQLLNDYFYGREVSDVLFEFPGVKLGVSEFLATLGQLLPRYYSISSSMLHDSGRVSITVAVVRYHSNKKNRKGVTSTFLSDRIEVGHEIPIFVNNNPDFRLPSDPTKPIMMIGPGTGIAPFRAMLQERVKSGSAGSNTLYFGCRMSTRDFLYKEELEILQTENKLILHTAFSREQEKKHYVQHKIADNATEIWKFIEDGGHIYICGDAQYMERDVYKALHDILAVHGKMDKESSESFIKTLEKSKRLQKDTWF